MKKLERNEMKNLKGGLFAPGTGDNCLDEDAYECGKPGRNCCPGLTCEINGTGTGTICMLAPLP